MILHLLPDDMFSDYAITQFNTLAIDHNQFIVLVNQGNEECKYIKQCDAVKMIVYGSRQYLEFRDTLSSFKTILFHNISTPAHTELLLAMPETVKVGWVFWGFEVYGRSEFKYEYLGKQTRLIHNKHVIKQMFKKFIKPLITFQKYTSEYETPISVYKRVDFCLTDVKEDFQVAEEKLKTSFQWFWYNYYNIEETIGNELLKQKVNGKNILLGNSASITNNHLEIFSILQKFNLQDRQVITPLSYGENFYANLMLHKGKSMLGESFHPLVTFMERDAYNSIINSCCIVIMNHYRHQAMGNILTALWLGARVYLSNRSSTYRYFKRLGIFIQSVEEDLIPSNLSAFDQLEDEKVMHNRAILMEEYGKVNMLKKVEKLIKSIN